MQKFQKYDLVRVAKDLGPHMPHFIADVDAIVTGSYSDRFGGSRTGEPTYTLYLKEGGQCSWYKENQLTLIKTNQPDLLAAWEKEKEEDDKQKSDLDWIFTNGQLVLEKRFSASIEALAKCFTAQSLWGSHGEGYAWYENAITTLRLACSFLTTGDKDGWLAYCVLLRDAVKTQRVDPVIEIQNKT